MAGYRLIAEAQRELRSGTSFYEAEYPGLGKDFVVEIRRLCRRIVEAPRLGTEVQPGVRRRLVRRFPYAILYAVENSEIIVLAVAHQSRRPGYWTFRA
jgi:toxin ParE2